MNEGVTPSEDTPRHDTSQDRTPAEGTADTGHPEGAPAGHAPADATTPGPRGGPGSVSAQDRPLSWPPPGLEWIQGKVWRAVSLAWIGALVAVGPLLWSVAFVSDFSSLGPLEGHWEVGLSVTLLGALVLLGAFALLVSVLKAAARGAELGYGSLTIAQVACDLSRDTGFLLQGLRHFSRFSPEERRSLVRARLIAALMALIAPVWIAVGFSVSIALAARGLLGPRDVWYLTLGPAAVFAGVAVGLHAYQALRVRLARRGWHFEGGGDEHVRAEVSSWAGRLEARAAERAIDTGSKGRRGRFNNAAVLTSLLALVVMVPLLTVSATSAIGPILASVAVPDFLSVQEMAGAVEALRRYRLEPDESVTPLQAGQALNNLAWVGLTAHEEPFERPPARHYAEDWFPNPDRFPNPYEERIAYRLMTAYPAGLSADEAAAVRSAAAHPAQVEMGRVARAAAADLVSSRWLTPLPDSMTMQELPWPHFDEYRFAGLAHVARAAVERAEGRPAEAERTLRELVSTGFVLI
ncbi:MAG: hypothetical protein D6701_00805, partial [Gemmatimonadetes bacterium]